MKIFYVDPNATTSQYNYPLVEELNRQGVNATLYSTINRHISSYYQENYKLPADYIFFKLANRIKNQKLRRFFKLLSYPIDSCNFLLKIKKHKPDIIHYNWLAVPLFDLLIIKKLKKQGYPIIITRHNYIAHENNKMQPGSMECLKLADHIICLSDSIKNRFPISLQSKISVINHGNTYQNELDNYTPSNIKTNEYLIKILLIGSLKPYKGVILLLKAFHELITEQELPQLRLKIIGSCSKPLAYEIENFITLYKIDSLVERTYHFISYNEMFDHIRDCSVGILPYQWGSQSGLPYLFYAFNKPLILSNSCGIAEQGNPEISLITKPEIPDIKESINLFIKNRLNYHSADFTEFLKQNDISIVADKIIEIYHKINNNMESL